MYPLELIQGVRLITDVCLDVTPGENVLCLVDREENIKNFLPVIDDLFEKVGCGSMITIEKAEIIRYNPGK